MAGTRLPEITARPRRALAVSFFYSAMAAFRCRSGFFVLATNTSESVAPTQHLLEADKTAHRVRQTPTPGKPVSILYTKAYFVG
jgi:hypothetical protein